MLLACPGERPGVLLHVKCTGSPTTTTYLVQSVSSAMLTDPAEGIRLGGEKNPVLKRVFLWRIRVISGNLANISTALCISIMFHRRIGVKNTSSSREKGTCALNWAFVVSGSSQGQGGGLHARPQEGTGFFSEKSCGQSWGEKWARQGQGHQEGVVCLAGV